MAMIKTGDAKRATPVDPCQECRKNGETTCGDDHTNYSCYEPYDHYAEPKAKKK